LEKDKENFQSKKAKDQDAKSYNEEMDGLKQKVNLIIFIEKLICCVSHDILFLKYSALELH